MDDLKDIYSRKELPPLPEVFNDLAAVDLDTSLLSATDIIISVEDVDRALKKTKSSTSSGPNQIG